MNWFITYFGLMFLWWGFIMLMLFLWDDDCDCNRKKRIIIRNVKRKTRFRKNKGEEK